MVINKVTGSIIVRVAANAKMGVGGANFKFVEFEDL